jgi:hypothetical protein
MSHPFTEPDFQLCAVEEIRMFWHFFGPSMVTDGHRCYKILGVRHKSRRPKRHSPPVQSGAGFLRDCVVVRYGQCWIAFFSYHMSFGALLPLF